MRVTRCRPPVQSAELTTLIGGQTECQQLVSEPERAEPRKLMPLFPAPGYLTTGNPALNYEYGDSVLVMLARY